MKKFMALLLILAIVLVGIVAYRTVWNNPSAEPSQTVQQPTAEPTASVKPSPEVTPSVEPSAEPTPTPSAEPSPEPSVEPQKNTVRLGVISGPTGMGAAKLLSDSEKGEALNHYEVTIAADNTELVPALTNGEIDIATVASNVALNLYNKTGGAVKIIALGTQGVLHILEGSGGTMIESLEDLAGETIYAVGQGANPEYILRYLLEESGVDPDEDVEIVFAQPAEIQAKLISGEIRYAMLPVPAATAAIIKGGGQIRGAIDLTEAWEEVSGGSQLIMTAVIARTEFIQQNPDAVNAFLKEYEASIDFVNANVDEAAELIAGFGITPHAAIAKQAIPQCHLVYIDGRQMSRSISDYFRVLYSVDPTSVGGSLPDDAIYYVP